MAPTLSLRYRGKVQMDCKKLNCRSQIARRICANGMAWLTYLLKHAPPYMCYHAESGRSALKGVAKIGERWNPFSWDGRRGWLQDTRPSPHVLRKIW